MRVVLNDDQLAIASSAADLLSARPNETSQRTSRGLTQAFDDAGWRACGELGWFALGIPEAHGGIGYGPVEEMVLFREIGRFLAPGPFLSTVAAGWVAVGAGDSELATEIFAGNRRVGLVRDRYLIDAEPGGLVLSVTSTGMALHEVGELAAQPSVDPSVSLSRADVGRAVAEVSDPLLPARAHLLVAAAQLGIAEATRDMSSMYALERHQFGRPIGAFQAVKHRCAEMAIRCYASYSRRTDYSGFHAGSANVVASSAARRGAADNVQNHGAIGFTQEHMAGWFVRRAQVWTQALDPVANANQLTTIERERYSTMPDPVTDWFAEATSGVRSS
jgi:alkylation response protein AidB-like acyl-CoA dehydrogenase